MVNSECKVKNKTDSMYTAEDLEDCTIGSIFGKGLDIVLKDTVSRSNDEVSLHGFMGTRHQQRMRENRYCRRHVVAMT